jgi:hypothetical protein
VPQQPLVSHPATPDGLRLGITVSLAQATGLSGGGWSLRYEVQGDLAALIVPAPTLPGPADGLWQHTCFEAFVAEPGADGYQEFNFSPSGQWASYRFSAERVRDAAAESARAGISTAAPSVVWHRMPDAFVLQAQIPSSALRSTGTSATLEVGLTAVIETRDHPLTYWALRHPCPTPDFHHRSGFALQVPARLRA